MTNLGTPGLKNHAGVCLKLQKPWTNRICHQVVGTEGFIQDPATKETKRFHLDQKSWTDCSEFTNQLLLFRYAQPELIAAQGFCVIRVSLQVTHGLTQKRL